MALALALALPSPGVSFGNTTVGSEIRKLRQARGVTQSYLAREAGVSASSLSRWEAHKRLPSIPELEAVLTALEASAAQRRSVLRLIDAPRAVHRLRALEPTASESYTSGGQLLWAMRQRKGWTQTETARAASVTQAQVARWESGDSWPSAADLHALCWSLQAEPEEVAALTRHSTGTGTGNGTGTDTVRRAPGILLLPEESFHHFDSARWASYVSELLNYPPPESLFALTFIGVQQHLSRLAVRHDFAAALLPDVYAIHARQCLYQRKVSQAAHWAERGLALVRQRQRSGLSLIDEKPVWFGNVLALASYAESAKRPASWRRAVALLRDWLPVLEQGVKSGSAPVAESSAAHHAWGQMRLAHYLYQTGNTHEALMIGQAACDEGERIRPSEGFMRLRDFAGLLLSANQPAQALESLTRSETLVRLDELDPNNLARHRLIEADCFSALGDKQSADERISIAGRLITAQELWHLQPDLQRSTCDAGSSEK